MTDLSMDARLRLPAGSAPVACVDIGGTKVAVSIADERGMLGKLSQPTCKTGDRDALARQIAQLIAQSCAASGVATSAISAVGVASCGPFVLDQGLVELAAPNICGGLAGVARGLPNDWVSVPLQAPLQALFPNVRVANDAIAALEAERRWGALQGVAHCAYVTWSTGIGLGLCVDGHVLRGKNGNAGHAGHTYVNDNLEALCGCGQIGDVEGIIAGNAIERRLRSQGFANAAALFQASQSGDAQAQRIVDDLCVVMARMLYNLVVTLDLQRIAIGGSVFWHNQASLLPVLQRFLHGKLPSLTDTVTFVPAGLGDSVGDYAALALVA
jgi:glucokinase